MRRGKFITLEGGEGAGKTTQGRNIAAFLAQKNIDYIETREPGGTAQGEALRALLVQGADAQWQAMSELLLIIAARVEHIVHIIEPALSAGKWVICDRFFDSTLAYQAYAGELGKEKVMHIHNLTIGDYQPDLTFLFDVPVTQGLTRAMRETPEEQRFEQKGQAYHETIRAAFLHIAETNAQRIVICDAQADMLTIWRNLEYELCARFFAND